jgi:two-component system, NtrC family, sensor histidine kinase HydH
MLKRFNHEVLQEVNMTTRLAIITASIIGITSLHYFTPVTFPALHEIYQKLYYLPILLAAFWFGLKGGIMTAMIVSILYTPHVVLQWHGILITNLDRYVQIFIYILVAWTAGFRYDQEKQRRQQLEQSNQVMEELYRKLQDQARTKVLFDEELRPAKN